MAWFTRINSLALLLCFTVIVFGAFVRLSDAGLGCPDWPGCYGHLVVPEAPPAVAAAAQTFPLRPVEAPKAWKEMIHRYLASTLGLLIVSLALMSVFMRKQNLPRILPWALVALVIFQGMLGMWTVTWQLKPLAVTGHLLGGMTTLSLLLWMRLSLWTRKVSANVPKVQTWGTLKNGGQVLSKAVREPSGLRIFASVGLIAVACQIFLGGWTSSNYAALACPDFPTCHGSYWPETDAHEAFTIERGPNINYEYGILDNRARVTIHFFHRLGALTVTVLLLFLGTVLLCKQAVLWRRLGLAVLAALALQVALGISIVKLQLPLALADMHNAGAAILLMTLVTVNFFVWNRKT